MTKKNMTKEEAMASTLPKFRFMGGLWDEVKKSGQENNFAFFNAETLVILHKNKNNLHTINVPDEPSIICYQSELSIIVDQLKKEGLQFQFTN